jgi:hypothetical protein
VQEVHISYQIHLGSVRNKPVLACVGKVLTFFVLWGGGGYAQRIDNTFPENAGINLTLKKKCSASMLIA